MQSFRHPAEESNLVLQNRSLPCCPAHSQGQSCLEYPDLDSNQGLDLRTVRCYPLHHRDEESCQL